ncbi:MAG: site-specific integrase [Ignavibacteriaceae bacterium]|nr:site-specific integrase [Ignavibacteriaceae bacterium]
MATVRKRGKIWHIHIYKPREDNTTTISTYLPATIANKKIAIRYADQLQKEMSKRNSELKQIGIKDITILDAKEHFLRYQQDKHTKTKNNFKRTYDLFKEFHDENKRCTSINKIVAEDFIIAIRGKGWQPNTNHTYVTHFIHFLNFLFEYKYTPMFKINKDVKTKPEVKDKIIFTDPHIKKIRKKMSTLNSNQQTTFMLLFYTGLRPSDILSFTCEKIDLKKRMIKYYSSKNKRNRQVFFHKELIQILKKRIDEVGTGKLLNYDNVESISRAVARYFKVIKLKGKGYSARTFRKTFITLCRNRFGIEDAIVREIVGHSQGNVPDKFYNQIDDKTIKKALDKFKLPGA